MSICPLFIYWKKCRRKIKSELALIKAGWIKKFSTIFIASSKCEFFTLFCPIMKSRRKFAGYWGKNRVNVLNIKNKIKLIPSLAISRKLDIIYVISIICYPLGQLYFGNSYLLYFYFYFRKIRKFLSWKSKRSYLHIHCL